MLVRQRITRELDIPDLHDKLRQAQSDSGKSISEICRQAGISRAYWYKLVNNDAKEGVAIDTLRKIEEALEAEFGVVLSG